MLPVNSASSLRPHQQAPTLKKQELNNQRYSASLQKMENQPSTSSKAKEDGTGTFESWDYVFRNLESQGYGKNLTERPDVLSPSPERISNRNHSDESRNFPSPMKDLEETLMELWEEFNRKAIGVDQRLLKITEALQKVKLGSESEHCRISPGKNSPGVEVVDGSVSAYDNMSSPPTKDIPERERPVTIASASSKTVSSAHITNLKPTTITLPHSISKRYGEENDRYTYAGAHYTSTTLVPKHLQDTTNYKYKIGDATPTERPKVQESSSTSRKTERKENSSKVEQNKKSPDIAVDDKDKWECVTCTFLNVPAQGVCEMCGMSKIRGYEVRPLASGGQECPRCTLVNEKGVGTCEACGASLKV